MSNQHRVKYLLELINNKTTLKTLTGENKKAYKYIITGIFINIIQGQDHEYFQKDLYEKAEYMVLAAKSGGKINSVGLNIIKSGVVQSMKDNFLLEPENYDTTTKVISFFRNRLKDILHGKSLFQAIEIADLIDVKAFMKRKGTPFIHNHNWIDFNLDTGLIHTTPVYILLDDLKIHWNNFIELVNRYEELHKKLVPYIGQFDFDNIVEISEIRHSYSGLYRTMIFTAVTFVEAFLLDVLINIKEVFPKEKEKYSILKSEGNISDKEIIENLIFKMFPSIKSMINDYYKTYKEILNYRDRYVHASSYREEHTNLSQLEYLLEFEKSKVKLYLDACIKMVKCINDHLPIEIQSLYWWDRIEEPDFTKEKKVSLLSTKKQRKKLSDYEQYLSVVRVDSRLKDFKIENK